MHDAEQQSSSAHVYRLIPLRWCEVVDGQWEFQSGAFDNSSPLVDGDCPDDMSVVLGDQLVAPRTPEGLPSDSPLAESDPDRWGVAKLDLAFLQDDEDQIVYISPQDELAHGDVHGSKGNKRRRRLKKHATWVCRPAQPPPPQPS